MASRASKILNEEERIRVDEITARKTRLRETRRWLDGEYEKAKSALRAVESSQRSINDELNRLSKESDDIHGYNDPWPDRDAEIARSRGEDHAPVPEMIDIQTEGDRCEICNRHFRYEHGARIHV